jgi:hypothetical protein
MFYKHELVKCICSENQLHYVGCDCASSRQVGYTVTVNPRGYFAEDTTHVPVLAPEGTRAHEFEAWAREHYGFSAVTPYAVLRNPPPLPSVTEEHARYMTRGDNT